MSKGMKREIGRFSTPPKYSLLQEISPHQGKLFSYYFARVNQATAQVLCCQRALPRK